MQTMKRSAPDTPRAVDKRIAVFCNICFEPCSDVVECRFCKKSFCTDCFRKYIESRHAMEVEYAERTGQMLEFPCPCCRQYPFFKPDFFIPSHQQSPWAPQKIIVYCGGSFEIIAVREADVIAGMAFVMPDAPDAVHLDDLSTLEKHAVPTFIVKNRAEKTSAAVLVGEATARLVPIFTQKGWHVVAGTEEGTPYIITESFGDVLESGFCLF